VVGLLLLVGTGMPVASGAPDSGTDGATRLDINRADAATLAAGLPGIGAVKAAAIVAYRVAQGPFLAVDDLLAVKGIGPRTLERLRPLITLGDPRAGPVDERERATVRAVRRVIERARRQAATESAEAALGLAVTPATSRR